ncbi:MAG: hypothetical protein HOI35_16785, partial [Woeseia sp.]|nr:hypothetical protein [Woeseia sp.]
RRGLAYLVLVAVANLSVFNAYAESVSSADIILTNGEFYPYDHVIALRAVETVDFMTNRWARLPYFSDTNHVNELGSVLIVEELVRSGLIKAE